MSCSGEPYADDFFLKVDDTYYYRRKTLFNLYSFDAMSSNRTHTPELIINNCVFIYFFTNYDSLIESETNNYYMHTDEYQRAGFVMY